MTIHLLQEVVKGRVVAKCGAPATKATTTVWWGDVDCIECRPFRFTKFDPETGGYKMEDHRTKKPRKVLRKRRPADDVVTLAPGDDG